jgi:hypothetical protein
MAACWYGYFYCQPFAPAAVSKGILPKVQYLIHNLEESWLVINRKTEEQTRQQH